MRGGQEQRVDEFAGLEGLQIVDTFTHADETQRLRTLAGDRRDHAALGRAVELGEHQPGDADRLVEGLDLHQRVLADVRIKYQQDFVRRARVGLVDDPPDLCDLFHEVELCRQAPGGVGQHDVDTARPRGIDRVEHHRRRISAFLGDDRHAVALAPGLELFAGGRAEGVSGG